MHNWRYTDPKFIIFTMAFNQWDIMETVSFSGFVKTMNTPNQSCRKHMIKKILETQLLKCMY